MKKYNQFSLLKIWIVTEIMIQNLKLNFNWERKVLRKKNEKNL